MKAKVKKYAGGMLTDSSGNPVRSSSGEPVRTRSDAEFDEDNKFGGYGKYMPKTRSITLGGKSSAEEDRPKSSGVEDYESGGKRAGVASPFAGPKEYISESIKEDTETELPRGIASGFKSGESKFERNDNEVVEKKNPAVKKKAPSSISASATKRKSEYEDTGAKIGSQGDFKMKPAVPEKISGMGPKNTFLTKERMGVKDTSKGSFMDRVREHLGNEFKSKKMASGGKVSTASSRGDGIAQRGKTKGRIC